MNSLFTYILRRLLIIPFTLIGVSVVVFLIVRLAPGDPVAAQLGELTNVDPGTYNAAKEQIIARMHLDSNYLVQYWYWLADLAETGLGTSIKYRMPVIDLIRDKLPVTIGLNLAAFAITYILAIPLGMLSAVNHNKPIDRGITLVSFLFYSMPSIWVGTMLLVFLANPEQLDWFPAGQLHSPDGDRLLFLDWVRDLLWHVVLPIATLSYAGFAYVSKQMRAGLLDTLRQDFVRTARAKGLTGGAVLMRHTLPNSLTPIITLLATLLPSMVAGSIIVETIFSLPGMGRLVFEAIGTRDFAVIQAVAAAAGLLNMIGLLLADILYAVADPRISYD